MFLHAVPFGVLFRGYNLEVLQPVVLLVAVDVVDEFKPTEPSSQMRLHPPTVLPHVADGTLRLLTSLALVEHR
jgi:hypothetical protein